MGIRGVLLAGLSLAAACLVAGCGSSQAGSRWAIQVSRAADITGGVPGYRIQADMSLTTGAGPANVVMSGIVDRKIRRGVFTTQESILGRRLTLTEKFSGTTFYLQTGAIPGVSRLTHGKRWLKVDFGAALGALGIGTLPTSGSDPSKFVDYLRAVSSNTTRVGTSTVRGVKATHYHAKIDLDRYPSLLPAADRASATRSIRTLEAALGGHILPVDVWIDAHRLVRRIDMSFNECVATQHVRLSMSMDLFDYGPQPEPTMPAAGQSFDITPLMKSALSRVKLGCSAV